MKASAAWRKLRARLLAERGNACEHCAAKGVRLSIHHRYYEAGKKDWDYDERTLELLCPTCHGKADELRRRLVRATGRLHPSIAEQAIGYMGALGLLDSWHADDVMIVQTAECAAGVAVAVGAPGSEYVIAAVDDAGRLSKAALLALWRAHAGRRE